MAMPVDEHGKMAECSIKSSLDFCGPGETAAMHMEFSLRTGNNQQG